MLQLGEVITGQLLILLQMVLMDLIPCAGSIQRRASDPAWTLKCSPCQAGRCRAVPRLAESPRPMSPSHRLYLQTDAPQKIQTTTAAAAAFFLVFLISQALTSQVDSTRM